MQITKKELEIIKNTLESVKKRTYWGRGVKNYAIDLLDVLKWEIDNKGAATFASWADFEKLLLNGAENWSQYSWGGCSLIYDYEIAEALCTPSELKKTRGGERRPNSAEEWLDVQARALSQAFTLVKITARGIVPPDESK